MSKKSINRLMHAQPDYLLLIVRKPDDWEPKGLTDAPPLRNVMSVAQVASYEEARDDQLRCNRLAQEHGLKQWAIVQSPGADL